MSREVAGRAAANVESRMTSVPAEPGPATDEADAMVSVVAHSLLSSMAIVAGGIDTLREHWAVLGEDRRDSLLSLIGRQCDLVNGILRDLVLGLPADALAALDAQARHLDADRL